MGFNIVRGPEPLAERLTNGVSGEKTSCFRSVVRRDSPMILKMTLQDGGLPSVLSFFILEMCAFFLLLFF
jgi:hypothetical protein